MCWLFLGSLGISDPIPFPVSMARGELNPALVWFKWPYHLGSYCWARWPMLWNSEQEAQTSMGVSVSRNPEHYFPVSQRKLWSVFPVPMLREERTKNLELRPAPWRPNSWATPQGQCTWLPGQKRWLRVHLHSAPAVAGSLVGLLWRKARCTGKVWLFLTHSNF